MTTGFQRARSEEQREARRQAILSTAAAMLTEMAVADISLNELSRRVGLAKSNVLRYFESREAVLLELFDDAWRDWLDHLHGPPPRSPLPMARCVPGNRGPLVAVMTDVAGGADRLLCELVSVSAGGARAQHLAGGGPAGKRPRWPTHSGWADIVRDRLPELGPAGGDPLRGRHVSPHRRRHLAAGSPDRGDALRLRGAGNGPAMRIDFAAALRETLATLLAGCLARWPRNPGGSELSGKWR